MTHTSMKSSIELDLIKGTSKNQLLIYTSDC